MEYYGYVETRKTNLVSTWLCISDYSIWNYYFYIFLDDDKGILLESGVMVDSPKQMRFIGRNFSYKVSQFKEIAHTIQLKLKLIPIKHL